MMCKECVCNDCVLNIHRCVNTPRPCASCDCDICDPTNPWSAMDINFCNHHLTVTDLDAIIEEKKRGK